MIKLSQSLFLGMFISASFSHVARAEDALELVNSFQISFCEEVRFLEFEASPAGHLNAYGFAKDTMHPGMPIKYYRWDLLEGTTLDQASFPAAADVPRSNLENGARSPDGTLVALSGSTQEIVIINRQTLQVAYRLTGHRTTSNYVVFSQDGKRVAAADGYMGQNVWVWDLVGDPTTPVQAFVTGEKTLHIAFTNADQDMTIYGINSVQVFNIASGSRLTHTPNDGAIELTNTVPTRMPPNALIFDETKTFYAAAVEHGAEHPGGVAVFKASDNKLVWQHDFPMATATPPGWPATGVTAKGFAFSRNGACLIVPAWEKTYIFRANNGEILSTDNSTRADAALQVDPSGEYLVSSGTCHFNIFRIPALCR